MGQKSSIDKLSPQLREKLKELLNNPSVTQLEVVNLINDEAGEAVLSKSSVNRYKLKMERFGEKMRQAREVAEMYVEKFGAYTRNKLGKVVNEHIRIAAFDLVTELEDIKDRKKIKPEQISDIIFKVSRAIRDLEHAEKLNAEREAEIKAASMTEAVEKVEKIAKNKGVSIDIMNQIKAELLGVA